MKKDYAAFLLIYGGAFLSGVLAIHAGELTFDSDIGSSPILYGRHVLPSVGVLIVAGSVVAAVVRSLARQDVDRFSLAVFIVASVVSLHYIHISRNETYTNDWYGHFSHAKFISEHWLEPYNYRGDQDHHPPLYYYLAAAVIRFAGMTHTIPVLTALRFFSWCCYLVFCAFNVLSLRRAEIPRRCYSACVSLLLLWPLGLHLASTINSQMCCYALYAAAFYYALLWHRQRDARQLLKSLILSSIALMVRGNALVLFMLDGLLIGVARYRGYFYLRTLLSNQWSTLRKMLAVCCLAYIGTFLGFSSPFISGPRIVSGPGHFLSFHYAYSIAHPFNDWANTQSFWDYLLKTAIFGEFEWTLPALAVWLHVLLDIIVFYAIFPWLIARRSEWHGMLPFMAGLGMSVLFLIAYTVMNASQPNQDARLIYPAVLCLVALFGRSYTILRSRGAVLPAEAGLWAAWGFAGLSAVYFWTATQKTQIIYCHGIYIPTTVLCN